MDKRSIEIMRKTYQRAKQEESDLQMALSKAKGKLADAKTEHDFAARNLHDLEELAELHDVVLEPEALFTDAEARGEIRLDSIEGRAVIVDPVTGASADMRDKAATEDLLTDVFIRRRAREKVV